MLHLTTSDNSAGQEEDWGGGKNECCGNITPYTTSRVCSYTGTAKLVGWRQAATAVPALPLCAPKVLPACLSLKVG